MHTTAYICTYIPLTVCNVQSSLLVGQEVCDNKTKAGPWWRPECLRKRAAACSPTRAGRNYESHYNNRRYELAFLTTGSTTVDILVVLLQCESPEPTQAARACISTRCPTHPFGVGVHRRATRCLDVRGSNWEDHRGPRGPGRARIELALLAGASRDNVHLLQTERISPWQLCLSDGSVRP